MRNDLVDFWKRCDLAEPPFAHPDDWQFLRRQNGKHIDADPKDFDGFVTSPRFGDPSDHRFHLSLLPVPYGGDLARADIVILLLNPGFSYIDYYAETRVPAFRRRLEKNLAQEFAGVEFPFLWLDPEFCWHSGFIWWEKKLRRLIEKIAEGKFSGRYLYALRDLSSRLAIVELVPYHSLSFQGHALIDCLPSVAQARCYVHDVLLPATKTGVKTVIVTRQKDAWGLKDRGEHLEIYSGGQTRGASLGPGTPGGGAILKRYGIAG